MLPSPQRPLAPLLLMVRRLVLAFAVVSSAVAASGAAAPPEGLVEQYKALGLKPGASPLDVQLAYHRILSEYDPGTKFGTVARRRFVAASQAFQQLSDEGGRSDILEKASYFDHVRRVHDDDDLRRFTEFRTGGSAHLRVICFLEGSGSDRHWETWAAATQLNGNALVAQLSHHDAASLSGEQGSFMASLKVRQFPSAVIYDPISRAVKVSHGLAGVVQEAQKFLLGDELGPSEKLGRVQELDGESLRTRCGEGATECSNAFVLATTAGQEEKLDELMATLRGFVEASRMLHNVPQELGKRIACFWLRLGRDTSGAWLPLLQKQGMALLAGFAYVAVGWNPPSVSIAPAHMAHGSNIQLQGWFRGRVSADAATARGALVQSPLPAPPTPTSPSDEPVESAIERISRRAQALLLASAPQLEQLKAKAERHFKRMDNEEKVMVVGAGICFLLLVLFVLRRCCCCCCCCARRNSSRSEEEVLSSLAPIFEVQVRRQSGEKLGLGITPAAGDSFVVTSVVPDQSVARWNAEAPAHLRIGENDLLVAAAAGGARVRGWKAMSELMKAGGDLSLFVAPSKSSPAFAAAGAAGGARAASLVLLQGSGLKSLGAAATLRSPELSFGGAGDESGVEIASFGPELTQWNATRREQGLCCMQQLEVGDRILSVNGSTDVRSQLEVPDPLLLVVRFRPTGALSQDRFEVKFDRKSQEDRLGLHIRNCPGTQHIEVVESFAEGAIARRNASGEGRPILPGDRLVKVNGDSSFEGMKRELGKLSLSLEVERWVEGSAPPAQPFPAAHTSAPPVPSATTAAAAPPPPQPSKAPPEATKPAVVAPPRAVAVGGGGGHDSEGIGPFLFILVLVLLVGGIGSGTVPRVEPSVYLLGPQPLLRTYATAGLAALAVGGLLALRFLWYELSMLGAPSERRTLQQLVVAAMSSACLGYGSWFLLIWAGVHTAA